jgi:DUF971 family protein
MSHEGIRIVSEEQRAREAAASTPSRAAVTPAKVRVLLTEGKGLEIDWADGHQSAWTFAWLRDACPCATCNDERVKSNRQPGQPKKAELLPMFTPPPRPESAHPVGRYALQFNWNDGHSGGIYSWDFLRRVCQCAECRAAQETAAQPVPAPEQRL